MSDAMIHKHCIFCGVSSQAGGMVGAICPSKNNTLEPNTLGDRPHAYPISEWDSVPSPTEPVAHPEASASVRLDGETHCVSESPTPASEDELVKALKGFTTDDGTWMQGAMSEILFAIRAYVAERVAEAEQQSKKFTYCAYCGHTESVDVDGEIIAQHIRTCKKHPLNIEIANLKAQQAERLKEAERQARIAEAKMWSHNWYGDVRKLHGPDHIKNCRDCQRIDELEAKR